MLGQGWLSVTDGGPAVIQHCDSAKPEGRKFVGSLWNAQHTH